MLPFYSRVQMLLFIQLTIVKSTVLLQDMGSIQLSSKNSLIVNLPDYFEGIDLIYGLSHCTNSSTNIILQEKYELKKVSHRNWLWNKPIQLSKNRQIVNFIISDYVYNYDFSKDTIFCYSSNVADGDLGLRWTDKLSSSPADREITGLGLYEYGSEIVLLIAITGKDSQNEIMNQIQMLNASHPMRSRKYTVLDLPELVAVKNLRIHRALKGPIVAFFGDLNGQGFIFLYNFTNVYAPKLFQVITRYYSIPSVSRVYINPISAFAISWGGLQYLFVLDETYGLISYVLGSTFIESGYLELALYKNCTSFQGYSQKSTSKLLLIVLTDPGILVINALQLGEISLIPTYNILGDLTPALGVYIYNDYSYITVPVNSTAISLQLSHLVYPESSLSHLIISYNSLSPLGNWGFFYGPNYVFYTRTDGKSIQIFRLDITLPTLNLSAQNCSCLISATDIFGESVFTKLTIIETPNTYYAISNLYQGKVFTDELTITYTFIDMSGVLSFPASMFSGWNQTIGIEKIDIGTESFLIEEIPNPKINYLRSFEISEDCKYIEHLEWYIVLMCQSYMELVNLDTTEVTRYNVSGGVKAKHYFVDGNFYVMVISNFSAVSMYSVINETGVVSSHQILPIKCVLFDLSSSFMVCGNRGLLLIYTRNELSSDTNFNLFTEFLPKNGIFQPMKHIAIMKQSPTRTNEFLYVGMKTKLGIIDLTLLNPVNKFTNFVNQVTIGSYSNLYASRNQVYIVTSTSISIYNYELALLRQVPVKATSLSILEDFLFIIYDSELFLIDGMQEFLINSVYFTTNMEGSVIGSSYYPNPIFSVLYKNKVSIYSSQCPVSNSSCQNMLNLNMTLVNPDTLLQNITQANLTLSSTNSLFKSTYEVNLLLVTFGMNIFQHNFSTNFTVDYSTESIYSINDFISGEDMQAELHVNNQLVNSTTLVPAYLEPTLKLNGYFSVNFSLLDQCVITNTNWIVATTIETNLLLIDVVSQKVQGFYNLSDVFEYQDLACSSVKYVSSQMSYTLLILGCTYAEDYETYLTEEYNNITKPLLAAVVIDLSSLEIVNSYSSPLKYNSELMKVIQGTQSDFVVLIIDGELDGSIMNNHILRFAGSWDIENLKLSFVESINFFTLGLQSFLAVSVDGIYNYRTDLVLYVIDYWYGVRVLNTTGNLPMRVISSTQLFSNVSSIGLCGPILYLGFLDTSITEFIINADNSLRFSMIYYPYNNSTAQYSAIRGFITCNNFYETQYIALQMASLTDYVVRIFNLKSDFSSSIARDIKLAEIVLGGHFETGVSFIDSNTMITIEPYLGYISSYTLQDLSLIVPKLTDEEYNKLVEYWGTNIFTGELYIYNGKCSYLSKDVIVTRTIVKEKQENDPSTPAMFWALVIGGVLLCVLIFIGYFVYRLVWIRKRRQQFKLSLIVN